VLVAVFRIHLDRKEVIKNMALVLGLLAVGAILVFRRGMDTLKLVGFGMLGVVLVWCLFNWPR